MSPDFCYDLLKAGRGYFADVGRGSVKTAFCDMIVMAVAGITAHRRTDLVFVNGTLNAQKYRQDILACHVVPFIRANGGTFQQVDALPHVTRDNMDYLRRNYINVLPWPALSPDLSRIEDLWDQLDRMVRKHQQQPRR